MRAAIDACNASVLAGWRELGQVDRQLTKAHMQDLNKIRTIMIIYGVYSKDYTYYLIWDAAKPFQRCLRWINTVAVYIKVICDEKSVLENLDPR